MYQLDVGDPRARTRNARLRFQSGLSLTVLLFAGGTRSMCNVYPVQNVHYRHLPLDAKELEIGRQCPPA